MRTDDKIYSLKAFQNATSSVAGGAVQNEGDPNSVPVQSVTPSGPANVVASVDDETELEYGTASHVNSVVRHPTDQAKRFLTKNWTPCPSDKEVVAWMDRLSLSKANKEKLKTWLSHVQRWHDKLPSNEQARLDNLLAEWNVPVRDIAKLSARSLIKILAAGTVMLA